MPQMLRASESIVRTAVTIVETRNNLMSAQQPTNFPAPSRGTPSGQLQTDNSEARQITLWALLDAFRRRWIPTLAIAIPSTILAGALVWEILPPD